MKHYLDKEYNKNCDGNFVSLYEKYLTSNKEIILDGTRQINDLCPYLDPDATEYKPVNNEEFYKDLSAFLKAMTKDNKFGLNELGEFIEPSGNISPTDRTITFVKDERSNIQLTSDQFGFSAIVNKGGYDKNVYPYAKYIDKDGDIKTVVNTIWMTRTLGGSFLWPKIHTSKGWISLYNSGRGVSSYIEDRVDLTLYEIKESYEYLNSGKTGDGILLKKIINNVPEGKVIRAWLESFKTFENYIDFFCFNDFVNVEDIDGKKVYHPKNIFTGKSIKDINKYRYYIQEDNIEDKYESYKFISCRANKDDLEKAFDNLIDWISKRSKKMEETILNAQ